MKKDLTIAPHQFIEITGAKQNNLKNIDIKIPLYTFNVICGPSGSGKSSLAFETLFAEGQRRYTETLSNYARQYIKEAAKPLLDEIKNVPPPLLLGQKNSVRSSRSTVGTHSEALDLLRIIFSKVGKVQCPKHKTPLTKYSPMEGARYIIKNFEKGFLLCPIQDVKSKDKKILLNSLIKDGFSRIAEIKRKKLEVKQLSDIQKLPSSFYIVIDRLVFSEEQRIADSLSQCFSTSLKYNSRLSAGVCLLCDFNNKTYYLSEKLTCALCYYQFPLPITPSLFSFNSTLGACEACKGFGNTLCVDEDKVIPNPYLTLDDGALYVFSTPSTAFERRKLKMFCKNKQINMNTPWYKLSEKNKKDVWNGDSSFIGVEGFFKMLETKRYKMHVRIMLSRFKTQKPCSVCNSQRVRSETSLVLFQDKSIAWWSTLTFAELESKFSNLKLSQTQAMLIKEVLSALKKKIQLINKIGLSYLQVNRPIRTLSGGEFQRLNLVGQISGGLSQVLYILDEPTIGLHSRDSQKLIEMLQELLALGNTVVVVEHDPEVIEKAQNIIEMGPGSGFKGGEIIFNGDRKSFLKCAESLTASSIRNLKRAKLIPRRLLDKKLFNNFLTLKGCNQNNLKNIDIKIPLSRLVVCTGVSGSGKSSLVAHTLYPALEAVLKARQNNMDLSRLSKKSDPQSLKNLNLKSIEGAEKIKRVLFIDRSTAEGNQRSFIGTYMDCYTPIRNIMAAAAESQKKKLTPTFFSLNTKYGRCPDCLGLGFQEIEMVFMDPIRLVCDTCKGLKFQSEVLEVTYNGKNIHNILNLTIREAMDFFIAFPPIFKPLSLLDKVGLDYIKLGQSLSTLSGGESGRLKLARELAFSKIKETFYIFDEPSSGLHFNEVHLLLKVLHHLVDQGASVLLVEHNLQIQAESDYIIDLGPEASDKGGRIVGQGVVDEFIKENKGASAQCLKQFLNL